MGLFGRDKARMVTAEEALPGRSMPLAVPEDHFVNGHRIRPPFPPERLHTAVVGMGCFWGRRAGLLADAGSVVDGGRLRGRLHREPDVRGGVLRADGGHTEAVLVVFDPADVGYESLLKVFWEGHDPTQGMRQGNDRGTQYRSAVYWTDDEQRALAESSAAAYGDALRQARHGR